jgi:hypothetical protein
LSTFPNTVGSTNQPRSRSFGRHAAVAQRRVGQVAAGGRQPLVPDQLADRPRPVREQPVEGAGRHVVRGGDGRPGQRGIAQMGPHVPQDTGPQVPGRASAGHIGAGQIAVVEQRARRQDRTGLAQLGRGRLARVPSLAVATTKCDSMLPGPAVAGYTRCIQPSRSRSARSMVSRGSAMTADVQAPSSRIL